MPSAARARRLGERIREELAEILRREVSDPRLAGVTVTDVEVDREFSHATVFVTSTDPEHDAGHVLPAFAGAAGFLRRELAGRIPLRSFPRLRFEWDVSVERGARIEELLRHLPEGDTEAGEASGED
jgi:ribosome-binding factor A